jgi:hypothetical protein
MLKEYNIIVRFFCSKYMLVCNISSSNYKFVIFFLQEVSFTAEPIEDNIYNWRVKIFDFDPEWYNFLFDLSFLRLFVFYCILL